MKHLHRLAAPAALLAKAHATPVVVDVTGAQSVNLQGEAGNTVWLGTAVAGSGTALTS